MNVTTEQEAYLEAVRRALGDLDPATRDELLEDLPEHLNEVAAEGEGTLTERLGPPEAYAAELRAAAGLGVTTVPSRGLDDRFAATIRRARGALGIADRKTGPLFGYGRASEFLRVLAPGWWLLRGYLVAMAISWASAGTEPGLLPRLGGSTLAATLLLVVCLLASIWLGRRESRLPVLPRAGLVLGGLFLIIFGMVVFDKADHYGGNDWADPQVVSNNPYGYVADVYAYDEAGQPLTNVRLYDQDGNPIQLGDPYRCEQTAVFYQRQAAGDAPAYPYCPQRPPYLVAPQPGVPPEPVRTDIGLTAPPTATAQPAPTTTPTVAPTPSAAPTPTAEPTVAPTN